jgi:hypothetical protein
VHPHAGDHALTSILVIKYQLLALNLLALPPTQSGYFMLVNIAALKKLGLYPSKLWPINGKINLSIAFKAKLKQLVHGQS